MLMRTSRHRRREFLLCRPMQKRKMRPPMRSKLRPKKFHEHERQWKNSCDGHEGIVTQMGRDERVMARCEESRFRAEVFVRSFLERRSRSAGVRRSRQTPQPGQIGRASCRER